MRAPAGLLALLLATAAGCSLGTAVDSSTSTRSEPECDERTSLVVDYIAGARGEPGTPVTVARAFLRQHGLRASDAVEVAASPGPDVRWVRVVRAGKVVARVELHRGAEGDGWLVSQLDACTSFAG